MSYDEVQRIAYTGPVWASEREPGGAIAALLVAKDRLIVLRNGEPPFGVVLGVPHQAAAGEEHICEKRQGKGRRDSDENAALYALVAFTELEERDVPCKLVIMAHATTHDPNKKSASPYCEEIFAAQSSLLLECHGAGTSRRLALELSAGSNGLADTLRFGQALALALGNRFTLGVQKEAGGGKAWIFQTDGTEEEGELELAATRTRSLKAAQEKEIPALHLEAQPTFRKPADGSNTVTPNGLVLGRALALAIIQYHDVRE